jgi:hypothetical protein
VSNLIFSGWICSTRRTASPSEVASSLVYVKNVRFARRRKMTTVRISEEAPYGGRA